MAPIQFFAKSWPLICSRNFKSISTFTHLRQAAKLAEPPPPSIPASGSGRSPISFASPGVSTAQIPISLGFLRLNSTAEMQSLSQTLDAEGLMDQFTGWMTAKRWADVKELLELWVRSLDNNGKPNKPDVNIYNHYLRANLMMGASAGEMLDLVAKIDDYGISPNTASFNLALMAMQQAGESQAAEKLIERMLQIGEEYKESLPDAESYDLIIGMLLSTNQFDSVLNYVDLTLKSGYVLSLKAFMACVQRCANIATRSDNSILSYYALEFIAKRIARGEISKPAILYSVNEGLIVSALGTAGRTYNSTLLDGSWAILKRSLRKKTAPSPESYLAKIYAHANLGNLQKAFITLQELELAHGNYNQEDREGLFSPFYSLNPLAMACSKKGFQTLDMVYNQLEKLSRDDPPYKSIAALNCIILGCANTWDIDRAYQTFNSIAATFGLTPDIHSYNALICAFGKLSKIGAGCEPSKEMLKKIRRRCVREIDYESDGKVESLARQFNVRMGTEVRRDLLFNLQYVSDYS
ncbi:pentatricopeptide repeat-containing protein at1g26460 mitochondrial [Phtheirospermum japonicum]|uniref:Pentatricopeptide repeat-containing protein at1g26460 mitochondrial n=1 Tax=Phtheirospermum japonicum TaxID=374723 RepID=A0A830BPF9_9LAMI|nr:pentatricopeptide repeat-containing protein at1g26460 mitochondrial [Phtheirospermum japonicum]